MTMYREMRPNERELIYKLLEPTFPGRNQLSDQLESAKVRTIDDDGSLEFLICSSTKADHLKYVVPTEGEYEDPDGITVHVLLFVKDDRAAELEFYREDNTQVQTWPNPNTLRVFAPE